MVFEHNRTTYIFAELYDYVRCRGIIGVSVFDGKKFGKWKPIIIEDTHISYPFIFGHKSKVYMLLENSASKKLTLYEAVNFPFVWKPVKTLISDMKIVDTTLVKNDNGFYGFTPKLGKIRKDLKFELDENLNVTELVECEVQNPPSYLNGMHTYTATDKIEVIDIKTRRFNLINLLFRIINKLH